MAVSVRALDIVVAYRAGCNAGCSNCSLALQQCLACEAGYNLVSSQCVVPTASSSSSGPNILGEVLGLAVAMTIVVLVAVYAVRRYRRKTSSLTHRLIESELESTCFALSAALTGSSGPAQGLGCSG